MAKYRSLIGIIIIVGLMLIVFTIGVTNRKLEPSEVVTSESEAVTTETEAVLEETTSPLESVVPDNAISVKAYGAKGDGVTDDSHAFQEALNFASENNIPLVIPESSKPYLILSSLELTSNTHIIGYKASIFMPSHNRVQNIFTASSRTEISNVTIEGLTLLSENDQVGTGEYEGSFTSYTQGVFLFGIENLTIKDVQMENMYIGIKLDASKEGKKSENINIDNLVIRNSRTPLFITSTIKFKMSNSILDASGGATKFLHSAYIRGDTSDIEFNRVMFVNSPGGGIHVYNSNSDLSPPENIRIVDCTIVKTKVGIYLYSGASDIYIANLKMENIELPFKFNSAERVTIENVDITNDPDVIKAIGLFNMDKISKLIIMQLSCNAVGMSGYLFELGSDVNNVSISEVNVLQLSNVGLLYSKNNAVDNFVIENSTFEWTSVNAALLRFQDDGSNAMIRGNEFIYSGKKMNLDAFKTTISGVVLDDNIYNGF